MTIGIFFIGVDRYIEMFDYFKQSFNMYFLPEHKKKYFVITNKKDFVCDEGDDLVIIEDEGWRKCNLNRYKYFLMCDVTDTDYLYFFNGCSECNNKVTEEDVMPGKEYGYMCGSYHRYYHGLNDPFDRNEKSACYIKNPNERYAYRGGMHGGRTPEFIEMCKECVRMIDANGDHIPAWNDEPYFNKYAEDKNVMQIDYTIYAYADTNKSKISNRDKVKVFGMEYMKERKRGAYK